MTQWPIGPLEHRYCHDLLWLQWFLTAPGTLKNARTLIWYAQNWFLETSNVRTHPGDPTSLARDNICSNTYKLVHFYLGQSFILGDPLRCNHSTPDEGHLTFLMLPNIPWVYRDFTVSGSVGHQFVTTDIVTWMCDKAFILYSFPILHPIFFPPPLRPWHNSYVSQGYNCQSWSRDQLIKLKWWRMPQNGKAWSSDRWWHASKISASFL